MEKDYGNQDGGQQSGSHCQYVKYQPVHQKPSKQGVNAWGMIMVTKMAAT
jgi:hypothetical protein